MNARITPPVLALASILLAVSIIAPLAYVLWGSPEHDFLGRVMSGLLGTATALVGGIPVALWIDRGAKHAEERKQQESDRKRELELLDLLKEELSFANGQLAYRRDQPSQLPIQPLKSDLWAAVSAAGKLNLIQNHRLLNRVASAYYVLNVVRRIEEQAYRAARNATVTFPDGRNSVQVLICDARGFDQLLSDSISEALKDIGAEANRAA